MKVDISSRSIISCCFTYHGEDDGTFEVPRLFCLPGLVLGSSQLLCGHLRLIKKQKICKHMQLYSKKIPCFMLTAHFSYSENKAL